MARTIPYPTAWEVNDSWFVKIVVYSPAFNVCKYSVAVLTLNNELVNLARQAVNNSQQGKETKFTEKGMVRVVVAVLNIE